MLPLSMSSLFFTPCFFLRTCFPSCKERCTSVSAWLSLKCSCSNVELKIMSWETRRAMDGEVESTFIKSFWISECPFWVIWQLRGREVFLCCTLCVLWEFMLIRRGKNACPCWRGTELHAVSKQNKMLILFLCQLSEELVSWPPALLPQWTLIS